MVQHWIFLTNIVWNYFTRLFCKRDFIYSLSQFNYMQDTYTQKHVTVSCGLSHSPGNP